MELSDRRRLYAEEIEAISNIRSGAVVDALASVPRERFLGPGPWVVRGEADFQSGPRTTIDANPRHVYHNFAVAIDPERQLFNGSPGLLASAIDALAIRPGDRVLHVGAGTGYYTAVMAHVVAATGRVVAIEVDEALAARARLNVAAMPWVEIHHGDGRAPIDGTLDAILVNAGVTHPLDSWLDALAPGGRMVLPLTVGVAPTIGKGLLLLITRADHGDAWAAKLVTFVAIYSAIGLRDDAGNSALGRALKSNPMPALKRLRRDAHAAQPSCWLHRDDWCLATE
jgi:protein-L-isoaspartate(D-aspartate) O-methyltransferase